MGPLPKWEMAIVLYFFLGGIAAGSYFLAVLADILGKEGEKPLARMGYWIALPLALVLPVILVLDLGTPERAFNMFLTMKMGSPMSVGSWGLLGFSFFALLSWYLMIKEHTVANALDIRRKVGLIGGIFGFFIASYTGVLLSTTTLPLWGSSMFVGALFLLSGASTAIAVMTLGLQIKGAMATNLWRRLSRFDELLLLAEILGVVIFMATLGDAATILLYGDYAGLFWLFVLVGLLIPMGLQLSVSRWSATNPLISKVITSSAALSIIGGFILRYVIVMAGQA